MEVDTNDLLRIIGQKQVEVEMLRSQNQELVKLVRRMEADLANARNDEGETDVDADRTATD